MRSTSWNTAQGYPKSLPGMTRQESLLAKERALERILKVLTGTHITRDMVENVPGLAKGDRIVFEREEAGDTSVEVAVIPYDPRGTIDNPH